MINTHVLMMIQNKRVFESVGFMVVLAIATSVKSVDNISLTASSCAARRHRHDFHCIEGWMAGKRMVPLRRKPRRHQ